MSRSKQENVLTFYFSFSGLFLIQPCIKIHYLRILALHRLRYYTFYIVWALGFSSFISIPIQPLKLSDSLSFEIYI